MHPSEQKRIFRFGAFVFDPGTGEILKEGIRLKIQGQPLAILAMLLDHPGEIVTREELQKKLWPEDTFVDFEHSLNAAVKRLRDAMGDSADAPRYVETLARRGYRFIAALEQQGDLQEPESRPGKPVSLPVAVPATKSVKFAAMRRTLFVAGSVLTAVLVAGGLYFFYRGRQHITEKDTIVLADFANSTGDPVFDGTLKQALAVDLEQSPFLNILSDSRVAETLRLMGRSPGERVTKEVSKEICVRSGSKAVLTGSVDKLGDHYVIGLSAENCQTGDSLGREQAEVTNRESVIKALGEAATRLRERLGESVASVQKYGKPLVEMTTPSLEALKLGTEGIRVQEETGDRQALPFFERAIALDPNFAFGLDGVAVIYSNLGETDLAMPYYKRAFEQRDRISERENLLDSGLYYIQVTGEVEKSNEENQLCIDTYPRDFIPLWNLALNYWILGDYPKAESEMREALRLEPNAAAYASESYAYLALNRIDDAKATVDQALSRGMDHPMLRWSLYMLAFLRGDPADMQRQLAWSNGVSGAEDQFLSVQSDTDAYYGELRKARDSAHSAVESAQRNDAHERSGGWQADAALHEAEVGNMAEARQAASAALALSSGSTVLPQAALAFALAGDPVRAQDAADRLDREFPMGTIVQNYWLPTIRAAIELNRGDAKKALTLLDTARPYELADTLTTSVGVVAAMYPIYLRGEAYLRMGSANEAAGEFQKILDHRGLVMNCPLGSLAHLGLARAHAASGKSAEARAEYQEAIS